MPVTSRMVRCGVFNDGNLSKSGDPIAKEA